MRFLMEFRDEQHNNPNIYLFYLLGDEAEIKRVQDLVNQEEATLDFTMDMESDYGTLDAGSNPDWDIEAFGSVEVREEDQLELITKFRDFFKDEIKTPVGPIKGALKEYPTKFITNPDGSWTSYEVIIE